MNTSSTSAAVILLSVGALLTLPLPTSAAPSTGNSFKCLAAAYIVHNFSEGTRQVVSIREDAALQDLSKRVTRTAMGRLAALGEPQVMEGMNREVRAESKVMSDTVFKSDNENLSDSEMGRRVKAHMTARFTSLHCLA